MHFRHHGEPARLPSLHRSCAFVVKLLYQNVDILIVGFEHKMDTKEPFLASEAQYSRKEEWDCLEHAHASKVKRRKGILTKSCISLFVLLPWVLLVVLGIWTRNQLSAYKARYYVRPDLTYSPVQHVVEYETKIFTTGFPEDEVQSPFAMEPSDEVDALWKTLYPSLHQLIPLEQATKLVNRTSLYPHDEQRRFVIELDVFHQLHCLNMIRKATRPDYYDFEVDDLLIGRRHISHCIDIIRQSIMCASDITVYTFIWSEEFGTYTNQVKNPHTCRNFDAIRDWATINTNQVYFDFESRVFNDPLDPTSWLDGYHGEP